jgi:hypothetical protein
MSHDPSSGRKRKAVQVPEASINSDCLHPKQRKAPRASLDSMTLSQIASHVGTKTVVRANNPFSSSAREQEASFMSTKEKIQAFSSSVDAEVDAALATLSVDVKRDPATLEYIVAAGGCRALVQLLKICLQKAIDRVPAGNRVTEISDFTELTILHNTLLLIISVTLDHDEIKVGIAAIGGVEAAVKVMRTFPKCQALQYEACGALMNLAHKNTSGIEKVIVSGGIKVLLATVDNHLSSSHICRRACKVMCSLIRDNKERTELLIRLGGGATVAKVSTKWRNNDEVHEVVQYLAARMTACQPTVRSSCKSSEAMVDSPKVSTGSLKVLAPLFSPAATLQKTPVRPRRIRLFRPNRDLLVSSTSLQIASAPHRREVLVVPSNPRNGSQLKPKATPMPQPKTKATPLPKAKAMPLPKAKATPLPKAKATPELVSHQPGNDRKCKSTEALEATNMNADPESSLVPSFSRVVTSGSVPIVEVPMSRRLQQSAPVEEQGTIIAVGSSSEKRVQPEAQPSTASKNNEVLSELQESLEQDVFPIGNNDELHRNNTNVDNGNDDNANEGDASLAPIPSIRPTASWKAAWKEMESMNGWTLLTGGRPYLYVKPGRHTRLGELKLGIDYFDTEADVQTFARQHYGWIGSDDDNRERVDQYAERFISSQSTLGVYHSSSNGVCPSPKVQVWHCKPRNDSQFKPEQKSQHLGNDRKCMSMKVSEKGVGRHDRECQNTDIVTILEANGEGLSNTQRVVTRNNRSLRERKSHNARTNTERHSTVDTASASNTEHEESASNTEPVDQIQSIGAVIQDIFYSDNIGFDAALHTLRADLAEDATTWDLLVAVSGCFIVVPIMWLLVKEMLRWVSKE